MQSCASPRAVILLGISRSASGEGQRLEGRGGSGTTGARSAASRSVRTVRAVRTALAAARPALSSRCPRRSRQRALGRPGGLRRSGTAVINDRGRSMKIAVRRTRLSGTARAPSRVSARPGPASCGTVALRPAVTTARPLPFVTTASPGHRSDAAGQDGALLLGGALRGPHGTCGYFCPSVRERGAQGGRGDARWCRAGAGTGRRPQRAVGFGCAVGERAKVRDAKEVG